MDWRIKEEVAEINPTHYATSSDANHFSSNLLTAWNAFRLKAVGRSLSVCRNLSIGETSVIVIASLPDRTNGTWSASIPKSMGRLTTGWRHRLAACRNPLRKRPREPYSQSKFPAPTVSMLTTVFSTSSSLITNRDAP